MEREFDIYGPIRLPVVTMVGKTPEERIEERPVTPITDAYIARLPLPDRLHMLEERIDGYIKPLLRKNHPLLADVQNEEGLHFASIMTAVAWQSFDHAIHEETFKPLMQSYQEERKTLQKQHKNNPRLIQEKLRALKNQTEYSDAQETFENSKILYDTTIDLFLQDLFLSSDGRERLVESAPLMLYATGGKKETVEAFLLQAIQRLQRWNNQEEHPSFFCYKDHPYNLSSAHDAGILRNILTCAFPLSEPTDSLAHHIESLGKQLLTYYWNAADSLYPQGEETPHLALTHDVLFAASIDGNKRLFEETARWIHKKMKSKKDLITKEYTRMVQEEIKELEQEAPESNEPYILGIQSDRSAGLSSAFAYMETLGIENIYQAFLDRRVQQILKLPRQKQEEQLKTINRLGQKQAERAEVKQTRASQHLEILLLDTLVSDLLPQEEYLIRKAKLLGISTKKLVDPSFHWSILADRKSIAAIPAEIRDLMKANAFLQGAFLKEESHARLEQVQETNIELMRRIQEENRWFVATHGDSFPLAINPHLTRYHLSNMIFRPDPTSQGHTIELHHSSNNRINIILTQEGALLLGDRTALTLPWWLQAQTTQVLLQHLFFITSGGTRFQKDRQTNLEDTPEVHMITARRHHWAYYLSTPAHPIHLQSRKAQRHNDFIYTKYGFGITGANLFRWRAGTLQPTPPEDFLRSPNWEQLKEYAETNTYAIMTFHKEHEAPPGTPPNQLSGTGAGLIIATV